MKKILVATAIFFLSLGNIAWISETDSEVVSDLEVIVRTSLQATEVLTSNTLALLYGTTRLGGATKYSSFDTGGTLSFKNVISSIDTMKFNNNQMLSWVTTTGVTKRFGLSSDNRFVLPASIDAENYNASFDRIKVTSVDSLEYRAAGTPGISSSYSVNTGSCTLTFKGGILTSTSC